MRKNWTQNRIQNQHRKFTEKLSTAAASRFFKKRMTTLYLVNDLYKLTQLQCFNWLDIYYNHIIR